MMHELEPEPTRKLIFFQKKITSFKKTTIHHKKSSKLSWKYHRYELLWSSFKKFGLTFS
jgi:hypothetical protein